MSEEIEEIINNLKRISYLNKEEINKYHQKIKDYNDFIYWLQHEVINFNLKILFEYKARMSNYDFENYQPLLHKLIHEIYLFINSIILDNINDI